MAKRLKKMVIREISLVDQPASPGSYAILAKGRSGDGAMVVGFDPILTSIRKAARDDDEDTEDTDDDDDTEYGDDDERPGRPTRREEREAVHSMVNKILSKRYGGTAQVTDEGDDDGVDNRNADEKAADAQRVADAANAHPPVASETVDQWLKRVYGSALAGLDGPELAIARKLYKAMMQQTQVQKSASDALDTIAKRRAAADPTKTYFQHWRDLVTESPSLYSIHKGAQDVPADTFNADHQWNGDESRRLYAATPVAGGEAWGVRSDGSDGGGSSMDFLNQEADAIRKRSNGAISKAKAFTQACAENPEAYGKMRRETR